MIWWARWQLANLFMRLSFMAMPRSAARELLVKVIALTSRHMVDAVDEHRTAPSNARNHTME